MESHIGRITILSGANELRVLNGGFGDRSRRCPLAHHTDPVFVPDFLRIVRPFFFTFCPGPARRHEMLLLLRTSESDDTMDHYARNFIKMSEEPLIESRKAYKCQDICDRIQSFARVAE